MLRILIGALLSLIFLSSNGQPKDEAYKLGVEGVLKVDRGFYKEGIKLLKAARNLEPGEYDYSFEIAKAYMKSGLPKKAEKYLYELQYHEAVQADLYVLLATCYAELEMLKKSPSPENKRAMNTLRYGIQKLPNDGVLYLYLAKENLKLERTVEALSLLETGIQKSPNFSENYFWAAKLMQATGNDLWAWFYAEVFLNMTDDLELRRSAALIVSESSSIVLAPDWSASPDKLDQQFAFSSKEKCTEVMDNVFSLQLYKRGCLLTSWNYSDFSVSPLFERIKLMQSKGLLEAYIWSFLEAVEKENFLKWLPKNAADFDAYREWRYWNPLVLKSTINRIEN